MEEMFCRYCGKEIYNDSIFCPHCGRQVTVKPDPQKPAATNKPAAQGTGTAADQPVSSGESVRNIFGSSVFLVLAALLTLYIPLHLAGTGSVLTLFLTIPTIIICVGCWITFVKCCRKQVKANSLAIIGGGLVAQIACFLAMGIALAAIAFYSFYINFLNQIGSLLDLFPFLNVSSGDLYSAILPYVILISAVVAALGVFLCHALRLIRQGIVSAKKAVLGKNADGGPAFRSRRTFVFVVAAAACCGIRLIFSYWIYVFFYILLFPYRAIGEGLMQSRFGTVGSNIFNAVISAVGEADGTNNLSGLKDFFLGPFSTGAAEIAAGVVFLAVLACVVVLLVQFSRQSVGKNN